MSEYVLEIVDLTKRFGEVTVLDKINFNLKPGECHGICGENGAGKSTLLKCISGIYPHGSYSGKILINDKEMSFSGIADSREAGIAVIYQELSLVDELSIAENIFLGVEPVRNGFIDSDIMYKETDELLSSFKLGLTAETLVEDLGVGKQQLVEIAKALSKKSKILLLDEPSAALTELEVDILLDIIQQLKAQGISCIYISHKLDEIFAVCDRVTVIRDGYSISTLDAKDTDKNQTINFMVGREITQMYPQRTAKHRDVILSVENLSVVDNVTLKPVLKDISFQIKSGEILGFGGLMGAGRTELVMHIFGAYGKRTAGHVKIAGKEVVIRSPKDAIQNRIMLLSEDRKRYGLVLYQSILFNMSLASLSKYSKGQFIDEDLEIVTGREYFNNLEIKASGLEQGVSELSGGNQQKVVLGKALMTDFDVIIFDEPTRGIDVGTKHEIYELMNNLTEQGKAVIMISSEMPELMGMSDRIIAISEGEIGGEFERADFSQEKILSAAIKFS